MENQEKNEVFNKRCEYYTEVKKERNLMGLNSFIKPMPIIIEKCTHPEVVQRTRFFYCEPDIHEWCPYYNSGLTNKDRD